MSTNFSRSALEKQRLGHGSYDALHRITAIQSVRGRDSHYTLPVPLPEGEGEFRQQTSD